MIVELVGVSGSGKTSVAKALLAGSSNGVLAGRRSLALAAGTRSALPLCTEFVGAVFLPGMALRISRISEEVADVWGDVRYGKRLRLLALACRNCWQARSRRIFLHDQGHTVYYQTMITKLVNRAMWHYRNGTLWYALRTKMGTISGTHRKPKGNQYYGAVAEGYLERRIKQGTISERKESSPRPRLSCDDEVMGGILYGGELQELLRSVSFRVVKKSEPIKISPAWQVRAYLCEKPYPDPARAIPVNH